VISIQSYSAPGCQHHAITQWTSAEPKNDAQHTHATENGCTQSRYLLLNAQQNSPYQFPPSLRQKKLLSISAGTQTRRPLSHEAHAFLRIHVQRDFHFQFSENNSKMNRKKPATWDAVYAQHARKLGRGEEGDGGGGILTACRRGRVINQIPTETFPEPEHHRE
jgi:hypothetical protein